MPTTPPSPTLASPQAPWTTSTDDVLAALDVSTDGLSEAEVKRRRDAVGANVLREVEPVSLWILLWNQFKSLVVALLVAAAVVSLFFGDIIEAAAIGVVLVLNAAIGFFTEWRAVRSMEALRDIGSVPAVVRRDGTEQRVDAESLVPGDVVVLEEGDVITADLRLLDASKLQVDESALTGESVPVDKQDEPVSDDTPLAERSSMAYKGTSVTRGSGEGVVVATGMETEIGEISSLVEAAEQESTPLEQHLNRLARSLVVVVVVLTAAVSAVGIVSGRDLQLMVETGIALAVAAIPEGLPVVATIALARGMRRMARRNALVRRLSSVETLGATSLICTDKTGTLTENEMTVTRLLLPREDDAPLEVSLDEATDPHLPTDGESPPPVLRAAAQVAALCNAAQLSGDAFGDPMEIALLRFAKQVGFDPETRDEQFPEVDRVSFDRTTKMMASVRRQDDLHLIAVKGAPEAVLDACTTEAVVRQNESGAVRLEGGTPLSDDDRQRWLDRNEALAADGLRVLGLAAKHTPEADTDPYSDLQFLGLVGLVDPPRKDVRASIDECQHAGIRVVMVTGDQPSTAGYVARAVGLVDDDTPAIHGSEFDRLFGSPDGKQTLRDAPIFARVTPKQKLDLIDLHQDDGRIVAMTGDGVNDAPALRSADIGVAMGQRGTQVAQEAADMVLQDDAFSTIVAAVEEGRAIFTNIRAFVRYLLSCNVAEVMVVGLAALVGLPLPLLPLQILFLNLVTDVFPALALGVGEAETDVMDHPPRPADEPVLSSAHWWGIAGYGTLFTGSVLGALLLSQHFLGFSRPEAVTVSFLTLAFGQLWHVFDMRSPSSSLVHNVIVRNPYVWGALGLCSFLLLLAVFTPGIAVVLSLVPPTLDGWLLIAGASLLPLVAGQISLAVRSRTETA